jgi:hypothetical protein
MAETNQRYFMRFVAAYVRGYPGMEQQTKGLGVNDVDLDDLSFDQLQQLFGIAQEAELRVHRFKRTMDLRRVKSVLGILRGLASEKLLDIGTGRGAFLWPLLHEFPNLMVSTVDMLEHRVTDIQAVRDGGIERLSSALGDATDLPFEDNSFKVVTALEVLEHIPKTEVALREICRVSSEFVVISVPSKEDDNPEHIHLLDQNRFKGLFAEIGVERTNFQYVPGHMIVVANVSQVSV